MRILKAITFYLMMLTSPVWILPMNIYWYIEGRHWLGRHAKGEKWFWQES